MSELRCVARQTTFELDEQLASDTLAPGLQIVGIMATDGTVQYEADYTPEPTDFIETVDVPSYAEEGIREFWQRFVEGNTARNCHFFIAAAVLQLAGVQYRQNDVRGRVRGLPEVDYRSLVLHAIYGMRTGQGSLSHSLLTVIASNRERPHLMTLSVLGNNGPLGLLEAADLKGLFGNYVAVGAEVYDAFVADKDRS